ncbi:MAG TPA: ABC transporter substrate-binding protein, partial [Flavobacteriaceae bacterium]|nr:ABC transporter substrate-binding protein [Flavobacteriaceae bacterium]
MNRQISLILLLIFGLSFQACKNNAQTSTQTDLNDENSVIVDDKQGEIRVPKSPERVVLFDLGALDIFDELGLKDRVVGIPKQTIPTYLEEYKNDKSVINTGSLIEPNFQKVNEANPDLIIIGYRQEKDYDEFSKIAPTVYLDLDYEDYINSISKNLQRIGEIYDMKEEADAVNEDMLQTIKEESADYKGLKGLFVMYNNGKFSAYGLKSRFGFVHDNFGVTPVSEDIEASGHGLSISSEYIQEMNPDIL